MVFREKLKDGSTKLSGGSITLADVFAAVYPIGSIHMSVTNTNPSSQFGGTWAAWGSGRVPVGVDGAQTEFDTVEETGGEKTHLLTSAEMPVHTHVQNSHVHDISHDHGGGTLDVGWNADAVATGSGVRIMSVGGKGNNAGAGTHQNAVVAVPALSGNSGAATAVNQNAGGGTAHNVLQPYITCYMWKRTA